MVHYADGRPLGSSTSTEKQPEADSLSASTEPEPTMMKSKLCMIGVGSSAKLSAA